MCNEELRQYAKDGGVLLKQVAEKWGVTRHTFSKKLRTEFSKKDSERFMNIVDEIIEEGGSK